MESPTHTISDLFAQLGLPSDQASMERFIEMYRGLAAGVALPEAPFWTPAQARFLREELLENADWVAVIETLNLALHPRN